MIRTTLTERLGLDVPIVQAALGPIARAGLAAAVCDAGGLGLVASAKMTLEEFSGELGRMRELTPRVFGTNHILNDYQPAAFDAALRAGVRVVTFALGPARAELVARAHAAGAIVMHQVHTVEQAQEARNAGVDFVIAQGTEGGGNTGMIALSVLLPQIVDAVHPLPVLAAGGIADGRGLAAALTLGACGVVVGTRFLASVEAPAGEGWKQAIVRARSEDAVKVDGWYNLYPEDHCGYADLFPRAIRTEFVEQLVARPDEVGARRGELQRQVAQALRDGRMHEYVALAGQSVGLLRAIVPVAEIVRRMVSEAEAALAAAHALFDRR